MRYIKSESRYTVVEKLDNFFFLLYKRNWILMIDIVVSKLKIFFLQKKFKI